MNSQVKIKITGKNPSTFLKEMIKEKINIYQLIKEDNSIIIKISYEDYLKLREKKTIYHIEIIEYYGLIKIKHNRKKYMILLSIWLMGIVIYYFLSTRIWKIEIINSNQKLVKVVRKDLESYKIKKYYKKINYKEREKIKEKILNKEKNMIEWMEIEEHGTKYIIKVEQKKKNNEILTCPPRNIISKKNAIILEIKASSGEIIKKKNDYVTKGETIISGWIHNNETVVSKKCSYGTVYGEVWYKVNVLVPQNKKVKKLTGQKKRGISLQLFQKNYNYNQKFRTYEKKEYNIIEESFLPIKVSFSTYYETKENYLKISPKEIEEIAIKESTKKIEKKLEANEMVISKKVLKKELINSKIKVEVFFKVKENITDYSDISQIDIEEMNKEKE